MKSIKVFAVILVVGFCLASHMPTRPSDTRVGYQALTILETNKAIVFSSALGSTNYEIFLQVQANLSTTLWASDKTTAGFTLNLSAGVIGNISYAAIER